MPPETCEEAVKNWINVKIRRQVHLQGGVSGASVYSVDAEIDFPGLQTQFKPRRIIFVIKYSSEQSFSDEIRNYKLIPNELKNFFIDFASPRFLVGDQFFMIMPYLRDYRTLASIVYGERKEQIEKSINKTFEVLKKLHFYIDEDRDPHNKKGPSLGKLYSMYLGPINDSFQRIDSLKKIFSELINGDFKANNILFYHPSKYFNKLQRIAKKISPHFSTWTHGDCHSRNIMIREKDFDLRFIDIDSLEYDSDYLYDLGTLIADLEIYNGILSCRRPKFKFEKKSKGVFSYTFSKSESADTTIKLLRAKTQKLAEEIDDRQWEPRLQLAKARYLLAMAPKTIDYERSFCTYCEGLRMLSSAIELLSDK